MERRAAPASLVLVLLFLAVPSARGAVPDGPDAAPAPIMAAGTMQRLDPDRQAAFATSAAWQAFVAEAGPWRAWWNDATGTPHRAIGPALPLAGFADDSAAVDDAVRAFVARHPELFRAPELETAAVQRVGRVWYARYRQRLAGLPVLASDWEFRVSATGRLFLFGADAWRASDVSTAGSRLARGVTRALAEQAVGDARAITLGEAPRLGLLPLAEGGRVVLRPVHVYDVRTQGPRGRWRVVVDAATGRLHARESVMRRALEGHVTGEIHPLTPLDALEPRAFADQFIIIPPDTFATDSLGAWVAPPLTGTLTAGLRGRFIDVTRGDAPSAAFNAPVAGTGTVDIAWTDANSHASERDAYYHLGVAHADMKRIDPGLVRLDRPVPCLVNDLDGVCNGFWDGFGIGLGAAGSVIPGSTPCLSAASTTSIVYHEYGHGITYERYRQAANDTLAYPRSGVLNEGAAEINAMFVLDDPVMGRGFYGPLTYLRTGNPEARWPEDLSANEYNVMTILTGSFWDLRTDVGKPLAERLFHFAMYGLPDDPDNGVAMTEYTLETLVADDDDGDLANGTPHLDAVLRAFNARGLGTRYFFTIAHTAIADQPSGLTPIPITATIGYAGPLGALDPASPAVVYAVDGGPWMAVPMSPTGTPDTYTAEIPVPESGVVRYYVRAHDTFGGEATLPVGAPARRPFAFLRGLAVVPFEDDMEVDRGWTVGAPDDSATGGVWVRVDPNPSSFFDPVQTGDDHTPGAGVTCWVTGNAPPNAHSNTADVDRGRTTLTSPELDASGLWNPVLDYYRWYANRGVNEPEGEYWRVLLSNDGGSTWVAVENTRHTENRWERILVRIEDYLEPTDRMRIRFVARDSLSNSTVEAAVDDVRLVGLVSTDVVLARFDATPTPDGIAVRWQFSSRDPIDSVAVERARAPQGPWTPVVGERHRDGESTVLVDPDVVAGAVYHYRLVATEPGGARTVFGPVSATAVTPIPAFTIESLRPNPGDREVRVAFTLPRPGHVRLAVYDAAGRLVAKLHDGVLPAGRHDVHWSGEIGRIAAGVYLVRLEALGEARVRRLALVH